MTFVVYNGAPSPALSLFTCDRYRRSGAYKLLRYLSTFYSLSHDEAMSGNVSNILSSSGFVKD